MLFAPKLYPFWVGDDFYQYLLSLNWLLELWILNVSESYRKTQYDCQSIRSNQPSDLNALLCELGVHQTRKHVGREGDEEHLPFFDIRWGDFLSVVYIEAFPYLSVEPETKSRSEIGDEERGKEGEDKG